MPRSILVGAWLAAALALLPTAPDASAQVPQIRMANVTVPEGDGGSADAVLTVTLSAPATGAVTVAFATENISGTGGGSCGGGADYVTGSGTVRFPAGETSRPLEIAICGDTALEDDETFRLRLSNAVGATIQDATARVTVTNDDAAAALPTLSIDRLIRVTEGDGGSAPAVLTLTLSAASASAVTVDFVVDPEATATEGAACGGRVDFVEPQPGTLRFDPGVLSRTVSARVCGDRADEADESFVFLLRDPVGATLVFKEEQGEVEIIDDDASGVTVSLGNRTVSEGDEGTTEAVLTATLSAPTVGSVTVQFEIEDISATVSNELECHASSDYAGSRGSVEFSPGETSRPVAVTICGDTESEEDETFRVRLVDAVGATIQGATGRVTITNDDGPRLPEAPVFPTLSVGDVRSVEGNAGTPLLFLDATLSVATTQDVTFFGEIASGTATIGSCAQGDDVQQPPISGPFRIDAGRTSLSLPISLCGDTRVEPDETFRIVISNPVGAILGDPEAVGTIENDDAAPALPTLAVTAQVQVAEPAPGARSNAVLLVRLSGSTTVPVSVDFTTVPGTARSGSTCLASVDYVTSSGVLVFTPRSTSRQIPVPICGDFLKEGSETFTVVLSNPVNATIAAGTGRVTIAN